MALRNIVKQCIFQRYNIILFQKYSSYHFKTTNYENIIINSHKRIDIKIHKRCMAGKSYNSDTDHIEDEDVDVDEQIDKIYIRNLLYSESKDPLVLKLNESASVQDVFTIIKQNYNYMTPIHISQSVLVLWDLQKIFYKHNTYYENEVNLNKNSILTNYMDQVNSHEDFEKLIELIEKNYNQFSLDALTCSLLYLNRMGVKLKANVMQLMITRCEDEIKHCDKRTFPLTSLSRFIVTVYNQESLYPILVSINALPIILSRLDSCETEEDFKLLTICLYKMKQLITGDTLHNYKNICNKLIDNNQITKNDARTIIKALRFLTQPQWYELNVLCSNKLMYLLKGSVHHLTNKELLSLFKVFQMQKEPADMLEEIQQHGINLLSELEDNINISPEITIDLLSCIVSFSSPLQRPKFEKIIQQYIQNSITPLSLSSLYKILYHVKSSDTNLCDSFWDKALNCIQKDLHNNKLQNMLTLCHKYIHFSHNVGHGYRYYNFEKSLNEYLINELNCNILSLIPAKFARIASFIIAYNDDHNYVDRIIVQALEMIHKFNSLDCLNISKGIQFAMENSNLKDNANINLLNSALNKCTIKELNTNNSLSNTNILLKSYVFRKGNIDNEVFKTLLNNFVEHSNELTSHIVKDTSFYLQINNCLEPKVINKITDYVIKQNEKILGTTADKLMHLCYSLGYTPENYEQFCYISSEIIMRDKERFTGLTFLQTCVALCFFQKIPDELIKHIFSVEFLEKLDEELSNCYAKTTYPTRVRHLLMQLNRAVCLDHPESNVPWFHQKYLDKSKKHVSKKDIFQKQVQATIIELLKDTNIKLLENTYSPYGYHLNFELQCDNPEEIVPRSAILLLYPKMFTNYTPNLKGYYQLKQRHLEILGYNVISINFFDWKLSYTQENCADFIRKKIWPAPNNSSLTLN